MLFICNFSSISKTPQFVLSFKKLLNLLSVKIAAVILFGALAAGSLAYFISTSSSPLPVARKQDSLASDVLVYSQFSPAFSGFGGGEVDEVPLPVTGEASLLSYAIPAAAPELAFKQRREIITYTVQDGDTPSGIAARFGISTNTLLWANDLTSRSYIRPGDKLEILPVSGVKHKVRRGETISQIAAKYQVDIDKIIDFNNLPADGFIRENQNLIIPGGVPPRPVVQKRYVAQVSPNLRDVGGYFIYPTSGRNWGKLHPVNAVDIANRCGTPIYAAAEGRVKLVDEVGWNRGYGKYMMISHPNGTETLYAHFSDIIVSPGTYVSQGQLIGYMGTTGHSTGCHLHFEVRGAKNPFARY